jgi:hypothetical protein
MDDTRAHCTDARPNLWEHFVYLLPLVYWYFNLRRGDLHFWMNVNKAWAGSKSQARRVAIVSGTMLEVRTVFLRKLIHFLSQPL